MTDYAKLKNDELQSRLKELGLPHTGKKADLVKRLEDHDASLAAEKPAAQPEPTKAKATSNKPEDEIDWDDEPASATTTTKPDAPKASAPASSATAAGGKGQSRNPRAVPNQIPDDTDPATTHDLRVASVPTNNDNDTDVIAAEIAKRKARAAKFGTDVSTDERLKALERAAKFGTTAGQEAIVSGLDCALDGIKSVRDRGREKRKGETVAEGPKKRRVDDVGGAPPPPPKAAPAKVAAKGNWMTDDERNKAEARKARFGS